MMSVNVIQESCMTSIIKPPSLSYPKKNVLIVDDIPEILYDLRQLLELTGLLKVVAEAGDGLEAVRLAEEYLPDAIVMDLEMPGLDGYEATRMIKAQNPTARVIILSAYAGDEEIERARAAGADGFVMKGERYEILVNAILGRNGLSNPFESSKGE
jgi:DNA-binding NarL/FixJ family response regulator